MFKSAICLSLSCVSFSDWMESPMMGGAEPDGVDNEVGNYWRTLYKLEKNFDSVPTAKRIAGKVCDVIVV